ncbi:MAG: DUF2889 domain-containing protein [Gammaproteobacteria bacterium]|jgi:hypothetical protein|nr:hypothetical protein [Gammaproteobacteria bacterium]MDP6097775.1 DUF2889 domain-containing protein [Gammaproteobacteria bacterium]|tara:strand:- start:521 stop:1087 length:567 start_codon:yes stop_codon:yes gene_type:complete
MPLPEAVAREHIHTREIHYRGYEREDGMWDIEAHMTDTKTYGFKNNWRGQVEASEPLHEMLLRITIDRKFAIQDVVAVTDNSPFQLCPDITPNYQSLIGIRMGPGWRKEIRKRVGGCKGCTHLTELLFPMATVAMQTIWPRLRHSKNQADSDMDTGSKKPLVLDTCHAWATDSPIVKEIAPKFYTGSE